MSRTISGTVAVSSTTAGSSPAPKSLFAAPSALAAEASGTAVAAVADTGGSQGDYTATSLSASGSWTASASGAFTYSYPIATPPALGGSAPSVALSYDSQSVDGETSARNSQSSAIGDGWSYGAGFIERTYRSCGTAGIKDSADECWAGWNATLSLGSHGGQLVRDASGLYHLQSDDGTRVERLTGASNGLWDGEYFKVTTTDGTAYYFGLNHAPGTASDSATNSAWGVPVYHPTSGDPCHDPAKGSDSLCAQQMGYRFNLDFVVDPNGSIQRYDWATEANHYNRGFGQVAASGGGGTLTPYTRAGHLTRISYGYKLDDEIAGREPSAQIVFNLAQRCVTSDTVCQYPNLSPSTAGDWPDTPYDLNCPSTYRTSGTGNDVCLIGAPTFWSTYRLKSIDTKVRDSSGWKDVDTYALTQVFSDAGGTYDPVTGKTQNPQSTGALQSVMWLKSIQRTGKDTTAGAGGATTLDPVTFTGIETDNRVDGLTPAAPPLYHPRISSIQTETGESIAITYRATECSRVNSTMPASADSNTMACYPVWWSTPGAKDPILDWFNKTLVTQVTSSDLTKAGSSAKVTNYAYTGGAAWHRDDSDLTDDRYRTWDQFHGYRTVTTTTGATPDPITQNVVSYLQGMDGDYKADGSVRSVRLANSLGEQVTDSPWLAGSGQESAEYTQAGGSVNHKTLVDEPSGTVTASMPRTAWTSQSPVGALSTLPPVEARRPVAASSRSLALLSDNTTWRTSQARTTFDSLGRVHQVDSKGDLADPSLETCTTTTYADAPAANPMMLQYVRESLIVNGACGTAASPTTTISHTRTFYDGDGTSANPGVPGSLGGNGRHVGLVTSNQTITGYDGGGAPQFQTTGAITYDSYGRVVKSIDVTGATTTSTYTPATGVPATGLSTVNPAGWTASSTLASGRSLVTKAVDANGKVTESTYDALGRRTAVWKPGRSKATQSPDRKFTYALHGSGANPDPSTVVSESLRDNGTYSKAVTIYDGMLQARQTQTTTADASRGRLITSVSYDSHGWAVSTIAPYVDTATAEPNTTMFTEANGTGPSVTRTAYDGQGRPTTTTLVSMATTLWSATTSYKGAERVDTTPPAGGAATSSYTNALGQVTSTVVRDTTADKRLSANAVIASGSSVLSKSTRLAMQADGNLVLTALVGGKVLWSSATSGHPGAFATMQSDGNFVVWDAAKTTQLWSSGTGGHSGGYLKVQGDENVVVFDSTNVQLWSSGTANTASTNDITTRYTYGPGGQLRTVKDAVGNTWTYDHNIQGQLVTKSDPDSGTSTITYDPAGRIATTTDARGQSLSYSYDALGRTNGTYAGTSAADPAKLLAEWTYDTQYKGLPDTSTRYVGGKNGSAYVKKVDSYNANYQPTSVTTVIPAAEGKLAGTYTQRADYTNTIGLPAAAIYNAEAGLPSETVGYGYNNQGGLTGIGSATTTYVANVLYSPLGQVQETTIGDDITKQLRTKQTYDAATGRLATNRVTLQSNTANPLSAVTFGYDRAGNLTAVTDVQSSGGTDRQTDTQCYVHDGQNRLVTAWTDTKGIASATAGQISKCVTGTPSPATIGGPAPYWLDWQYNRLGDRTLQVAHDITGNAARNSTQTSVYPGNGVSAATRPNAVTSITTANPTTGTFTLTPQYDQIGGVKQRDTAGSKTSAQTVTYNEEGRTGTVTTDGKLTSYLYDADGRLLIQRGPATNTLYLFGGAEQLTLDNTTKNVTGQRYYTAPDGTVTVRSGSGITYQPTTPQGTANLQVDASSLAVTRRAFDPYGNPRGPAPTSWADNHGYLGQPTDSTTGLNLLGARQYDPSIGRFLSVDPVFEAGDPNQMGGYTYAGNNPTTKSDPSGLMARGDEDNGHKPCEQSVRCLITIGVLSPEDQGGIGTWVGGQAAGAYKQGCAVIAGPAMPLCGKIVDKAAGLLGVNTNAPNYHKGEAIAEAASFAVAPEADAERLAAKGAPSIARRAADKFRSLFSKEGSTADKAAAGKAAHDVAESQAAKNAYEDVARDTDGAVAKVESETPQAPVTPADTPAPIGTGTGEVTETDLVFRSLREGESASGIVREGGNPDLPPWQHIVHGTDSPWISVTRSPDIMYNRYGEGSADPGGGIHGYVAIDLNRVTGEIADVMNKVEVPSYVFDILGIDVPGTAYRDKEMLVKREIDGSAIVKFWKPGTSYEDIISEIATIKRG
ncbi:RHS repeat domain-containing protein [Kitasatospora camelliae]|uniref:RHS repeat-associated core domain-containing protein n=1 Tax=Kitasatospora camelliae TaxID=3156397 RepID=A0AAU8JVR5_9ACTN